MLGRGRRGGGELERRRRERGGKQENMVGGEGREGAGWRGEGRGAQCLVG